jgi:glycosyltransferase involved in cell wall biosynthesis|tara:strand:- start:101 stop:1189 length:1089 start_codon:yes stop_codon:yes gene_type:complete
MTQKKLILFMPSIEGGGVEKNFFIISNFLAKKFKKTFLITTNKEVSHKLHNIEFVCPKSMFFQKGGRIRKYFICSFLLVKMLIKENNKFVFSFQANLFAILISKIFNTKILSRSNSSPSGWSRNIIKDMIYKIGFKLANTLIVNSTEFKNEIRKKFSVKSVCIYNPLNKDQILKESRKKVKKIFPKKYLKIIHVGRLVDQKDQLTILKAINELKHSYKIKLVLIGRGKNENKIKNYIKLNNLSKLVKIFYSSNPFAYINQAELFILSSRFEGLPNVLLESLTLKKFVISSSCPTGPKEILLNGKGGLLFKPGNYKDLSKKIIFYINNKQKCKKMCNLAIKNLDKFDYKKNLYKYLKVVKKYS